MLRDKSRHVCQGHVRMSDDGIDTLVHFVTANHLTQAQKSKTDLEIKSSVNLYVGCRYSTFRHFKSPHAFGICFRDEVEDC